MGNRFFIPPDEKPDGLSKSNNWDILKNRFSGKFLFRSNFYHLITGNLHLLDHLNNKWFLHEIFDYSLKYKDINFLPALKKISASDRFDENLRLRSSEIYQVIEEKVLKSKSRGNSLPLISEEDRIDNAKKMLADSRSPHTTEILRLLRDKSIELRRLGIFLIGKFSMTDMTQEVCGSINIKGVQPDAFLVLRTLGNDAEKELHRLYLASSGNLVTSKAVLSLLANIKSQENISFLLERVWSNSRQLREIALIGLRNCGFKPDNDEKRRLENLICETCGLLVWIISAKVSLQNHGAINLPEELEKDFLRWKAFLANLLSLTYDNSEISESIKDKHSGKDDIGRNIPEIAGIIFNITPKSVENQDITYERKILKKLNRFFHFDIPQLKDLPEEILNYDYNLISTWTKACTLRSLTEIKDEDLSESVVALLFTPSEILREEAARLLASSGRELFNSALERLPVSTGGKLDQIISGEKTQKELLFEKVIFLSKCFSGVAEHELLFLAEKMNVIKSSSGEDLPAFESSIIWLFTSGDTLSEVIIQYRIPGDGTDIKTIGNAVDYFYVLPFEVIDDFSFQYPESILLILKYIDKNEE
jgi:hypothetical protein